MKSLEQQKAPKPAKSAAREWGGAIVFAVVFATLIRWATFEAFAIPTPSMEQSLLVGDYLFVSKLHYGARTPTTPLQVPLTHQTLWGTSLPSYSETIQLPSFRLPGFSAIKRHDAVVFNFPAEEQHPVDLKTNYIKRCVAVAGDTIALRAGQVFINGRLTAPPAQVQHRYWLMTDRVLQRSFFQKHGIPDAFLIPGGYELDLTIAKAQELASLHFVKEVRELKSQPGVAETDIFPQLPTQYAWNKDNFGPLYVPKAGASITLTPATLPLYQKLILQYEGHAWAEVREGKLFLDGQETPRYIFKQNYYFMLGDNRHNSFDSRYWGFVPEDHVVGKAVLVWMSMAPRGDVLPNIRWNRLLSPVN